jgi:lysophospholipase L1-like esterase/peroxiredoxin
MRHQRQATEQSLASQYRASKRIARMRRILKSCVLFVVLVLIGKWAIADQPKPKNYIGFPIKTQLQRALLDSTTADVYLMFDVAEVMNKSDLQLDRIDIDGFRSDLAASVKQAGMAKPSLQICFRFAGLSLDNNQIKAVEKAVTPICRQAGFDKIRVSNLFTGGEWQDQIGKFANLADTDGSEEETPIEDEFMRIYPVHTRLARFILGDSDYDCYIELRQPIDGHFKELSEAVHQRIAQRLAELKLPHTRKLSFRCMTTNAGQTQLERYFYRHNGKPPLVNAVVKQLGFADCTVSSVPMSVSPEDLLGKPAPDFTLDALHGGQIQLHRMRHNRVALIAFWGVACGACCVEAPYLTALAKQFGDHDLFVVAVNGYDEPQETVAKFVKEKGLTHAVAMMGSKVAKDNYTVASYPVTFLLDREGKIVDYHLGFDPGDEKLLAESISKALAKPSASRFEKNVMAYEDTDKVEPPPQGAILLVGDSQFFRWKTLKDDLPGYTIINRGVDSFQFSDVLEFADRIVLPYKPRLIVLHVGGNDIHTGKTPDRVLADFKAFVTKVRQSLPDVPIVFSSMTPSPARWNEADRRQEANKLVQDYVAAQANLHFIDLWNAMLAPDGRPREDIWVEDRIHPNHAGYQIRVKLMLPLLGKPDKETP